MTRLPQLTLAQLHNCGRHSGQLQGVRASETCNYPFTLPDGLMGFPYVLRLCLQGGGFACFGSGSGSGSDTVTLSSCTITGNTAYNVGAHTQKFPIALMGDSHVLLVLFAGRRCQCPALHSGHLIVHHQWEHSSSCACSRSKYSHRGEQMRYLHIFCACACACRVAVSFL